MLLVGWSFLGILTFEAFIAAHELHHLIARFGIVIHTELLCNVGCTVEQGHPILILEKPWLAGDMVLCREDKGSEKNGYVC